MGEVYKARDTRLDRTVAIKVLPPAFAGDSQRRGRFEREAKAISALSHPHICALYDIGETDPSADSAPAALFLVMEYLDGETLAARLEKGSLPLDQALAIATEIADALAAAHRQGVVHRDLKPGNVMLTRTGAKLLDFGLAKLTGHGEQPAATQLASASRPAFTTEGTIVGTLPYMAPEQLEGKPADARTDLFAFGTRPLRDADGPACLRGHEFSEPHGRDSGARTTAAVGTAAAHAAGARPPGPALPGEGPRHALAVRRRTSPTICAGCARRAVAARALLPAIARDGGQASDGRSWRPACWCWSPPRWR